ncbi:glycosyl transferase family 4 [Haloarcula quadrata]|uniref:Glycosyl transferase group 1 n=2 Tax=Haloarcula TaxID=2237 RepID=Q5V6N5_HALMA|nr:MULTISPECIES: glycosyltransferase family 4 protein [Haloarcula]AAV44817.1 glycosyl transferase group 1 [Haloarcula marismortui ATCC 43049]QCP90129.1 glycosyltransferase family 1 protein [Haloarcula marismortui ATCC 43049]RKS78452.1 glycosyl transferase family 4 [Haloarcula quadrata]
MRVGLTLYGSLDEQSGGFRYDRKLVEGLRAAGDTVECIQLPWRDYHRGLLDNGSRKLRQRLDVDVDVMLQDELAHPSLVRTNRALSYPIVSIVHHLRASEPRRLAPLYRAVERRYLGTVQAVVCNSATTRNVVTNLGVDPEDTVVAPPAGDQFDPDIDRATIERRATTEPLQVVFVGNVSPRKGLDTLVDGVAAAAVDIDLTVVGRHVDAAHVTSVQERVREHDLADRVQFAGRLPDGELAKTLRSSHVLAVPSRYEGFGIVYLEGMSFGLPALATRAGGAADIVTDDETGVLVDPDDSAAVARELERFATDRDRLAEMGWAARRNYETHPDWEETVGRVRDLLSDIVQPTEVPA